MTIEYVAEFDIATGVYANQAPAFFAPNAVEIAAPGIDFSTGSYVNQAPAFYAPNSVEVPFPEIFFSVVAYLRDQGQGLAAIFHPRTVEIFPIALPPLPGDSGVEISFAGSSIPTLRPSGFLMEILYPVVPLNAVNKVLTRMDSQEWKAAQKATSVFVQKRSTIRFRVDTSYMATFLGDLHTNRTNQFRLQTPGLTPFGVNSQDNYVRLLNYTAPVREQGGLTYLVDVEFYFMAVFA